MYKLFIEWLRVKLNIPDESIKCEACEVLKLENAQLHNEINRLLDYILKSNIEEVDKTPREFKPILPRRANWQTERQRLEREDAIKENNRLKELALKAAGQPDARGKAQPEDKATTITAPSDNVLGGTKTIEQLEKEFEVELPAIENEKVN